MEKYLVIMLVFLSMMSSVSIAYCDDLTDWEWQVIEELWAKLDVLPEDAPKASFNDVYLEIANKYNLAIDELYYLEEEAYYYYWGF